MLVGALVGGLVGARRYSSSMVLSFLHSLYSNMAEGLEWWALICVELTLPGGVLKTTESGNSSSKVTSNLEIRSFNARLHIRAIVNLWFLRLLA